MTPIPERELEIIEDYELRLKDRYEYENELKNEIAKKDDTIRWLTSFTAGLSMTIVFFLIIIIFFG